MQMLQHVRDIRADEAHVAPDKLSTARTALQSEIAKEALRLSPAKRRFALGIGLGFGGLTAVGATALIASAIVAGSVVAPPPAAITGASATEVLQKASESVLTNVSAADTPLAPGQYLRIEITRDAVTTDGTSTDRPAQSAAFSTRNVTVLYVPADRTDDWIRETTAEEITGVYGPDGEEFLRNVKAEPSTVSPGVEAIPAGIETFGDIQQPIDLYRDSYDEMPRDPEALLAWFRTHESIQNPQLPILNALYLGLPPADLRAAMLGALARTDGLTLVSQVGNLATVSRGPNVRSQQFVVDTESGLIVSFVDPRWHENEIVPPELPEGSQTFTLSVVDSAPTPSE